MWRIPEIERARRLPDTPPGAEAKAQDSAHIKLLESLLEERADDTVDDSWLGLVRPWSVAVDYQPVGTDEYRRIIKVLRNGVVGEARRIATGTPASGDAEALREWHHRIFLGPRRLRTLVPSADPPRSLYAIVDVSFGDLLHRPMCQVHVSVWSAMPFSAQHTPLALLESARRGHHPFQSLPPGQVNEIRDEMERVCGGLYELVGAHLLPVRFEISQRVYDLPVLWVAVPTQLKSDPAWYLNGRQRMADLLAQQLLSSRPPDRSRIGPADRPARPHVGSAGDSGVTRTVLNGDFLVLRRVGLSEREPGLLSAYRPQYVVVPSRRTYPTHEGDENGRHDHSRAVIEQEDAAATLVTSLATLEAHTGSDLYDVERDLAVWENHLKAYTAVAERGAFLWDALATHLPMRRGKALVDAHRAVQLLHQMLLQGVADLGHLRALIRDCASRVDRARDVLQYEYDQGFSEPDALTGPGDHAAGGGRSGLRAAITETGLFERVQRQVQLLINDGSWVVARYDELTGAITAAFDERRVRELDVLQKAGVVLSFILGLVGLVNVVDVVNGAGGDPATSQVGPRASGWIGALSNAHRWAVDLFSRYLLTPIASHTRDTALLSLILAALAIVVAVLVSRRVRHSRTLSSTRFRQLYDGLHRRRMYAKRQPGAWHFLKDASTDTLEDFRRECPRPNRERWASRDNDLATRFADLWDSASAHNADRQDTARKDIKALSTRIEQWGIHGLLVTERPRQLHEYVLPRLICLYRHCMSWPGSFLDKVGDHRPESLVHESEFVRALQWLGFVRSQALDFDRSLAEWLARKSLAKRPAEARDQPTKHAQELLRLLEDLKFDATLKRQDIEDLLLRAESMARIEKSDAPWLVVPSNDDCDRHIVKPCETDTGSLEHGVAETAERALARHFEATNFRRVVLPEDPAPLIRPRSGPEGSGLQIRNPVGDLLQVEPGSTLSLSFKVRPTNLRVFQIEWTVAAQDPQTRGPAKPVGKMTGTGHYIDPSTGFIDRDPRARLEALTTTRGRPASTSAFGSASALEG